MSEWEVGQEVALIEAGAYVARCASIVDDEGQFGPQLKIIFEIVEEGAYKDEEIPTWVSAPKRGTITPRMNLYKIADALIGPLEPGKAINRKDMVGASCKLLIAEVTREDGTGSFSKITSYSRLRPDAAKPAKAQGALTPLENLAILFDQAVMELGQEVAMDALSGLDLATNLAYTPEGDISLDFSRDKPTVPATIKAINALKAALGR